MIRFVPERRDLQKAYNKLIKGNRLSIDSEGFDNLKAVMDTLEKNREKSNESTVKLTERLQKAMDVASIGISLQAVKAVKADHSDVADNALKGLEALIDKAHKALEVPDKTLEAIEEACGEFADKFGKAKIDELREALTNMDEEEAVKLYQRFGSNKTLLRRLLPDDIPRGKRTPQNYKRMLNKSGNDSAFAKLEAHIDAYYKVPKFKKYIASKYLKKFGSGFKGLPVANTDERTDFEKKFMEGTKEIRNAVDNYEKAQAADTGVVEYILGTQEVIEDGKDDIENEQFIRELANNGVEDDGLRCNMSRKLAYKRKISP